MARAQNRKARPARGRAGPVDDRAISTPTAGLGRGVDEHREQRDDEPPAVRPRVTQQTPQGMLVHSDVRPLGPSLPVSGGMGLAPAPGRVDDDVDALVLRRPAQILCDPLAEAYSDGRVAVTPRAGRVRHLAARHPLDGVHHLADRRGTAVAEIV